jgi:gamma-tubulin complex component 2
LNRIKPVLKAAYCASRLTEFITEKTRFNNGQVVQALCQSLDVVLKEFLQVIMTLDRKFKGKEIGLHQFCFHLVPFTRTLQSLLHLTFEIETQDIQGGALIRLLEDKISSVSGDRQLRTTYAALLEGCSKPFLDVLNRWLATGSFTDAHSEFMITDSLKIPCVHEDQLSEDLLTSRHSLNSKNTPRLLEDIQQKILLIGTYRNIQGVLDKNLVLSIKASLQWDRRVLQEAINEAYTDVNAALMTSLFQSGKLYDVMSATKRFFFVENCDFVQNFLLNSQNDLSRTTKEVSKQTLQGAFESALKTSCYGNDPFSEALQLELSSSGLYDSLVKIIQSTSEKSTSASSNNSTSIQRIPKISELLSMSMKIEFPESMILNSKALAKYQIVYRHLVQCVELIRGLSIPLNRTNLKVSSQIRQFEVMKNSMLQFIRTMHNYICQNVLEPQWERFSTALRERRFTSVEEITNTHMNFLDTCLRECMLTNSKLVQLIGMIWSTCTKFSALVHELNNRIISRTVNESTFQEVMGKFTALYQHFLKYVRVLIEALQYYAARDCDHYIANFLNSLDCQFYA